MLVSVSGAGSRAGKAVAATQLGVPLPLFTRADQAPAFKPG